MYSSGVFEKHCSSQRQRAVGNPMPSFHDQERNLCTTPPPAKDISGLDFRELGGSGFNVKGFEDYGLKFRASGSRFKVEKLALRVQGLGFES